ncbi:MAG TPA: hypothetical protein VLM42_03830 [Bryobacteraceae bacterium]|nr:hypothetical protein [Bryobacteraceae bacterium]
MSRETYAEPASHAKARAHTLSAGLNRTLIAIVALLILVPCFWQPYIEAGDLASHTYNAWLAGQIELGKVPPGSVTLTHPLTNVLSDWALEALVYKIGRAGAERIVVSAAVEIFFWGAFCFVAAVAGHRCWIVAPSLAMIAYGVVFHLGFLNFYISTGFSLWLMTLLWRPERTRMWLAIPLAVLALLAHALPLIAAVAALLYVHGLRRVPEANRWAVFIAGVCLLILFQTTLLTRYPTRWVPANVLRLDGIAELTGAGQMWLYGAPYLIVVAGILLVWFFLFLERLDRGSVLADPILHLWALTLLAFILLPSQIQFPQYRFPLAFIQPRISFFIAVFFCAVVAGGLHGRGLTRASCLLAGAFFTMLFLDAKSLNQVDAQLNKIVAALPPGQRVVAAFEDSSSVQLNGLIHVGSGACIGRCWDYGNYEPATAQFRVQASGPNPVVAGDMSLVADLESGHHVVTAQEAPLYSVCPGKGSDTQFDLRKLTTGETTCWVRIPAAAHF